jgi:tetratricopeptide (TPR) repeat protein
MGEPLLNLASLELRKGNLDKAEAAYREVVAIWQDAQEEYGVAWAKQALASVLEKKGEYDEAEALYREALASFRELRGDDHPTVASTLRGLASLVARLGTPPGEQAKGDCEEALPLFQEALEIEAKTFDAESVTSVGTLVDYGECLAQLGRFEAAEEQMLVAYSRILQAQGEDAPSKVSIARRLVRLYEAWGKPEKAAEYRAILSKE